MVELSIEAIVVQNLSEGRIMYRPRIIDRELDEFLPEAAAIAIDGPKGVGKTATALQRAGTTRSLDHPAGLEIVRSDIDLALHGDPPVLFDEWQRYPPVWDAVRRAVDGGAPPGSYLLTGSAAPRDATIHSGAGRILSLRMRPMAVCERGLETPTVSLAGLLNSDESDVGGSSSMKLRDYAEEIAKSGFPGIRELPPRLRHSQLESYVRRAIERDLVDEQGVTVRRVATLNSWFASYAAASSTTATWETIRRGAMEGEADPPSRSTANQYRDWLTALWLLDEVPAWMPTYRTASTRGKSPKHQLADPALVTTLLKVSVSRLLDGNGRIVDPRSGTLLGALFESLATLTVRASAQAVGASVSHLRLDRGEHEIDLIVEGIDGELLPIEVKLADHVNESDVVHLKWFRDLHPDRVMNAVVIYTGEHAYRRTDGIVVVPLALLH